MKGYKALRVVYNHNRRRLSSVTEIGTTFYHQGLVTFPYIGYGPLTVFTNLEDAANFLIQFSGNNMFNFNSPEEKSRVLRRVKANFGLTVFEVEYEESENKRLIYAPSGYESATVKKWVKIIKKLSKLSDSESDDVVIKKSKIIVECDVYGKLFSDCPEGTVFARWVKIGAEIKL